MITDFIGCDKCMKGYNTLAALRSHVSKDCEKERIACEFCPKSYTRRARLRQHCLQTHNRDLEKYISSNTRA
ncbi:hypothetical protein GWI33_014889 [Rhynchophorus ferrugineus]|uniref:C2H2-type domain-containing protein n=1 Tax=Rhynchophorus ferrugineus TaxID=354439 RepID=A0A834MAA1_RHYFE|nr:hypothetical protein GWI33_014889 [Rhynchophorus ferrugineus]